MIRVCYPLQGSGVWVVAGLACVLVLGCTPTPEDAETEGRRLSSSRMSSLQESPILVSTPGSGCQPQRTTEFEEERNRMVEEQIAGRGGS